MFIFNTERKNAHKDLKLFKSFAYKVCTFRAPTENIGFRLLGKNFGKKALARHYLLKIVNLKKCFFFFNLKKKQYRSGPFLRQENNIIFYFEQRMFCFFSLYWSDRKRDRLEIFLVKIRM